MPERHGLEPRRVADSETVISVVMEIEHTNNAGFVHGGTIMRLVDTAAGMAAARHSGRRAVTAAMDDMTFLSRVLLGDLLTVKAGVNDAHRTSMEIGVRVYAETIPDGGTRHVSSAHLVFVALDENGVPTAVPPVIAETADEQRRQREAQARREQRLARRAAASDSD